MEDSQRLQGELLISKLRVGGGKKQKHMQIMNSARFSVEDLDRLKEGVKNWLRSNTCDSQIDEAVGLLNKIQRQSVKITAKQKQSEAVETVQV